MQFAAPKISIFIIVLILALVLGCKSDFTPINNLNDGEIMAFGHGGMGIESIYPINSLGSAQKLFENGANAIELDIQLSSDSQLIAYHDEDLSSQTDFEGAINDFTVSEIEKMAYQKNPFTSESIHSLQKLLDNITWNTETLFTFDIKLRTSKSQVIYFHTFARALNNFIAQNNLQNKVHIESQDTTFLKILQKSIPSEKLFIYPSNFSEGIQIAQSLKLQGITIAHYNITSAEIEEAHKKGILIAVWNTHSQKDNTDAIAKSPDIIQTDEIKDLLSKLN